MTAPINFPTLSPPQVVAPRRSDLDGFAEFLVALENNRAARAEARKRLDLEELRTKNDLETSKLERDAKMQDMERKRLAIEAEEVAAPFVLQFQALGDKATPAEALKLARTMHESNKNKKLTALLDDAFSNGVMQAQQLRSQFAATTTAETNAAKGVATKDADIEVANLRPQVEKAQLAVAQQQLELSQLDKLIKQDAINLDPARRSQIINDLQGGWTVGQAYARAGRPVPTGVDPELRYPGAAGAGGGTLSAAEAKNEGLSKLAARGLTQLMVADFKPLSGKADAFRAVAKKEGILGAVQRWALNPKLTPEERRVLQGYALVGQAFATYITGASATDAQINMFLNTVTILQDDDPATQQQKRAFLKELPSMISGRNPVEIVDEMIKFGSQIGMSQEKLAELAKARDAAQKFMASPAYKKTAGQPLTAPDGVPINPALAAAGIRPAGGPP